MASGRLIIAGLIFMLLVMLPISGDAASAAAGPSASAEIEFKNGPFQIDFPIPDR
jgi:hypothetical protein